jgi:DNA-binding MarR family transcriptional regulator
MMQRPLQETTGYLLARTCKQFRIRVHAAMDEIGLYGGQQFVLSALWEEEGITHSELAERMHVQPATITNALKRMERAGFVERRHDAEDQRVSRVYLTDAGRDIRDAVEQVWGDLDADAFDGFTAEDHAVLRRLLLRVRENLLSKGV